MSKPDRLNPHFFRRDDDGSVRIRMRFTKHEADLIEEAAGDQPLVSFMREIIMDAAETRSREAEDARLDRLRS